MMVQMNWSSLYGAVGGTSYRDHPPTLWPQSEAFSLRCRVRKPCGFQMEAFSVFVCLVSLDFSGLVFLTGCLTLTSCQMLWCQIKTDKREDTSATNTGLFHIFKRFISATRYISASCWRLTWRDRQQNRVFVSQKKNHISSKQAVTYRAVYSCFTLRKRICLTKQGPSMYLYTTPHHHVLSSTQE